jgi:hypothetical protein
MGWLVVHDGDGAFVVCNRSRASTVADLLAVNRPHTRKLMISSSAFGIFQHLLNSCATGHNHLQIMRICYICNAVIVHAYIRDVQAMLCHLPPNAAPPLDDRNASHHLLFPTMVLRTPVDREANPLRCLLRGEKTQCLLSVLMIRSPEKPPREVALGVTEVSLRTYVEVLKHTSKSI